MKIKRPLEEFIPKADLVDQRGPTAERLRRVPFEVGDTGTITVRQSPVQRAVARGTLTERQGAAADKFYKHWYMATRMGGLGGPDLDRVLGGGGAPEVEIASVHRATINRALKTLRAAADGFGQRPEHAQSVLMSVVIDEMSLEDAGARIGFTGEAAKVMARTILRSCLNILIKEWGI